jgi:hypothetical protein
LFIYPWGSPIFMYIQAWDSPIFMYILGILPSICIFLGFSHLYVYLWDFSTRLYISMGCYVSIIYIYVHSLIFS